MKTQIGVIVRQRHIDRGRCRSTKSCPIALAMKEQLGTDKVNVYADVIWLGLQRYQIPFKARTFILNFDSGLPVDPLAFLMEAVPELSQPESPELRELEALRRQIFDKEAVPKLSQPKKAPPKQLPKGAARRWWSGVVGWCSKRRANDIRHVDNHVCGVSEAQGCGGEAVSKRDVIPRRDLPTLCVVRHGILEERIAS